MNTNKLTIEEKIEKLKMACHQKGMRVTPQRVEIYREVAKSCEHPDAETVYESVKEKMPNDELIYDMAEFFKVFADSTRMKIIYALTKKELSYIIAMVVLDIAAPILLMLEAVETMLSNTALFNQCSLSRPIIHFGISTDISFTGNSERTAERISTTSSWVKFRQFTAITGTL